MVGESSSCCDDAGNCREREKPIGRVAPKASLEVLLLAPAKQAPGCIVPYDMHVLVVLNRNVFAPREAACVKRLSLFGTNNVASKSLIDVSFYSATAGLRHMEKVKVLSIVAATTAIDAAVTNVYVTHLGTPLLSSSFITELAKSALEPLSTRNSVGGRLRRLIVAN
jgi:hypothetical protein